MTGKSGVGGLVGYNEYDCTVSNSHWDISTSGTYAGISWGDHRGSLLGLFTTAMEQFSNFSGWDSVATWQILEGQSYPGLRAVDDASFAFVDTRYSVTAIIDLKRLLANDYDVETSQANLILHVDSLSIGATDSTASATFPEGAAVGDSLHIVYRVGEVRATQGDTLWGALTLSRAPGNIMGEYAITLNVDDYPDYDITYTGAKLTISKAALTVTVHDTTMVLNADEPGYRFTCSGFVNGDTKSVLSALKATHNAITKAGTYALTFVNARIQQ